jgi:hypothetical protein
MSVSFNERECPHCRHAVLNWQVRCPGCDAIPWETPEGKQVRRRQGIAYGIKRIALMVVVGSVVGVGGALISQSRQTNNRQVVQHLDEISGRLLYFEYQLKHALQDTLVQEELRNQMRAWVSRELPMLLQMLRDHADNAEIRVRVISALNMLLRPEGGFKQMLPDRYESVKAQLQGVKAQSPAGALRAAATQLLDAMQAEVAVDRDG